MRKALQFIGFMFRTFGLYWAWSWRRWRGRMPVRGALDHTFTIRLEGPVYNRVVLTGPCSEMEARRLAAFRAVHEEPFSGLVAPESSAVRVRGSINASAIPIDRYGVEVLARAQFIIDPDVDTSLSGGTGAVSLKT